jgi:hypothetical protein
MNPPSNKSRACVKSADMKSGNDQIFVMWHFDEKSRWMGWLENEFSHSLALHRNSRCPPLSPFGFFHCFLSAPPLPPPAVGELDSLGHASA